MNENNKKFLEILKESFKVYLKTGARSNEKLKIFHGKIANDISNLLSQYNSTNLYTVSSLGYGNGKEIKIEGRYINKAVDITISKNGKPIVGIAVKYVMSNYKQNSNNYFENMLGETANIRSNNIPYFQIIVLLEEMPYYLQDGSIKEWEKITEHNLKKYLIMSEDNTEIFLHTPEKTLLYIVKYPTYKDLKNKNEYKEKYLNFNFDFEYSDININFRNNIIYNNYEEFINKIVYRILSL